MKEGWILEQYQQMQDERYLKYLLQPKYPILSFYYLSFILKINKR